MLYLPDEEFYIPKRNGIVSLHCNNKCSGQEADSDVVWNIHLLSVDYNITVSCHNGSCSGINEDTELLKLENDFIMANATLTFHFDLFYQKSLVGCVLSTDNCTENHFWIVDGGVYKY